MRLADMLLFAIGLALAPGWAFAQAPQVLWQSVRERTLAVNGIVYEIESAKQNWSITRSTSGNITRFEVRPGEVVDRAIGMPPPATHVLHARDEPGASARGRRGCETRGA